MTQRTFQVLLALAEGPLHGYGIKHAVEERTLGAVRLGSGTLYEAVHRLVESGQIEEVEAPRDQPSAGGPRRRFYALTATGRQALVDELRRMDEAVRYARGRDLLPQE